MSLSRREALGLLTAASASTLLHPGALLTRLAAEQPCIGSDVSGTLIGTLPLFRRDGQVQPFGVKVGGRGLDARLITDLSSLDPDHLVTSNQLVFVRTEAPRTRSGTIRLGGRGTGKSAESIADLAQRARSMGPHLLECAGNNNPANFGLLSVCEWDGVPLTDLVARLGPLPGAHGVLVSGVDPDSTSANSGGGASWVFPLAWLDRLGAFLAVRMNGEPLPPDHGAPIRLVVPGWYGCTWVKWVDEIRLTDADEPATGQMKEFAGRTHQTARHNLARDYSPADIQTAAMPVRVEKRRTPTGIHYRIVGIVWGGKKPVEQLEIRFRSDDAWKPFSICPPPATSRVWSLWEYVWKPMGPGIYDIALRVPDASVPQRRLDTGYYVRQVRVQEV